MAKIRLTMFAGTYGPIRMKSDCGASGGVNGGFEHDNTCWQLTGHHRERLAKATKEREEREAKQREQDEADKRDAAKATKRKDAAFKSTRLYKDISESLNTDDMSVINDFRGLMEDIHKQKTQAAADYNDAFEEIVDQFVGTDAKGRQKRGAFISSLVRADDPADIPGFDEVVQFVRDNPKVSHILGSTIGESIGSNDLEAMVFQGLKQGKMPMPALNSDEVFKEAFAFIERYDDEPVMAGVLDEENDYVPFSLDQHARRISRKLKGPL